MLFNSWVFAVFLPLVLLVYYGLRLRWQNVFLLGASYVFYGWWDYRFCLLLAISTIVDYTVGRAIHGTGNPRRRKLFLLASCVTNLGILGTFKYFGFFAESAESCLNYLGFQANWPTLNIILPVGISFYTFQTLSYTIDVYRGELQPCRSIIDFGVYVAFFPQLVAGPIERATALLPQIQAPRRVTWNQLSSGSFLILLGLFRKVAIADGVAGIASAAFSNADKASSGALLLGLYAFSLQIYGDFAGYSDIARGCARLMGFELRENFTHPYFSANITEFWRRWHMSLSSWLRDYLYIPLGGNRYGKWSTYKNLMLTMLLGGLWHGANWTFVVWGALHGVFLSIHKRYRELRGLPRHEDPGVGARILLAVGTFHLVALTWIFFRAPDIPAAWDYLTRIVLWSGGSSIDGLPKVVLAALLIGAVDVVQFARKREAAFFPWAWPLRGGIYAGMVLAIFLLRSDSEVPFIYFQF